MPEKWEIPNFPTPSVVEKVLELGFGSGPWERQELEGRWGDSPANKFLQDAKEYGWVVSPFRGTYYVPPAQDLMVVSWLPTSQREEFVKSRTLAATGLRFWCLSAWARKRGLDFAQPLFVTDLASRPKPAFPQTRSESPPTIASAIERNKKAAKTLARLPFLENLILVPELPLTRSFMQSSWVILPPGGTKKTPPAGWLTEEPKEDDDKKEGASFDEIVRPEAYNRMIRFSLSPQVDDSAWTVAMLGALGLPRLKERIPKIAKKEAESESLKPPRMARPETDFFDRVQRWGAFLGQPSVNSSWREAFETGQFPFLLVPPALWEEIASATAARRYEEIRNLKGEIDARS